MCDAAGCAASYSGQMETASSAIRDVSLAARDAQPIILVEGVGQLRWVSRCCLLLRGVTWQLSLKLWQPVRGERPSRRHCQPSRAYGFLK
jgi:hypothetical protein